MAVRDRRPDEMKMKEADEPCVEPARRGVETGDSR
jgi:hypothetical protein